LCLVKGWINLGPLGSGIGHLDFWGLHFTEGPGSSGRKTWLCVFNRVICREHSPNRLAMGFSPGDLICALGPLTLGFWGGNTPIFWGRTPGQGSLSGGPPLVSETLGAGALVFKPRGGSNPVIRGGVFPG